MPERLEVRQKGSGAHILVVDDEELILSLVKDVLEMEGYRVTMCDNGRDALDCFNATDEVIDGVVLDLMMPELNGREVLHAMQEQDPDAAVVVCSGFSGDVELGLNVSDSVRFIQKPYEINQLTTALQEVIHVRKERRLTSIQDCLSV